MLLIRTRSDVPPETSARVTAPLAPAALAPDREPVARPAGPSPTVGALLAYYTIEVSPLKATSTQYQHTKLFQRITQDLGTLPVVDVTPAVLRQWRDTLRHTLKPGSVRQYLDTFSAVLTVAVEELEWIPVHPMRKVRKPPPSPGRVRFLTAEEQERLLHACQASRNRALYPLVLLAMTTGARRGELLGLRWADVDLERGFLRLAKTKNGERRAVPVPSVARDALHVWGRGQPATGWVIPRTGDKTTFPGEHAWKYALRRARIRDFHFHDLRHSCASYLAMSGASLIEIAEVLGHKTLAMVKRYAHLSQAHTAGVVERMAQEFIRRPQPQRGDPHEKL